MQPNRALTESSTPPCCNPKFDDLPRDGSDFFRGACIDIDTAGHMTWGKDERMVDMRSGAVIDESVTPGVFNDSDTEKKPSTTIKRIFIPTLLVL